VKGRVGVFDDASTQHFFDCLTKPGCVAEGFLGVGPGDDRGIVFQLDGHEREVGHRLKDVGELIHKGLISGLRRW